MSNKSEKYIDLAQASATPKATDDSFSPLKKKLWPYASLAFALSPEKNFMWWRRALLRFFGAKIGNKVQIKSSVKITRPWNLSIGDRVWIGHDVELYSLGKIEIGDDAVISQQAYLCTGTHDYHERNFPLLLKPIIIECEAWVATRCFIGPGVTIGRGAIVSAQSVVLSDVPSATIYRGNPAIFVKKRPMPHTQHSE